MLTPLAVNKVHLLVLTWKRPTAVLRIIRHLSAPKPDQIYKNSFLMHESNCQTEQLNILKIIKYLHDYLLHKLALKKAAIILHIVRTNYIQDEHIPLVCTVAKKRHCLD